MTTSSVRLLTAPFAFALIVAATAALVTRDADAQASGEAPHYPPAPNYPQAAPSYPPAPNYPAAPNYPQAPNYPAAVNSPQAPIYPQAPQADSAPSPNYPQSPQTTTAAIATPASGSPEDAIKQFGEQLNRIRTLLETLKGVAQQGASSAR